MARRKTTNDTPGHRGRDERRRTARSRPRRHDDRPSLRRSGSAPDQVGQGGHDDPPRGQHAGRRRHVPHGRRLDRKTAETVCKYLRKGRAVQVPAGRRSARTRPPMEPSAPSPSSTPGASSSSPANSSHRPSRRAPTAPPRRWRDAGGDRWIRQRARRAGVPACESDDLRWRAPLGASSPRRCPDCRTDYHWYAAPAPEPTCVACGMLRDARFRVAVLRRLRARRLPVLRHPDAPRHAQQPPCLLHLRGGRGSMTATRKLRETVTNCLGSTRCEHDRHDVPCACPVPVARRTASRPPRHPTLRRSIASPKSCATPIGALGCSKTLMTRLPPQAATTQEPDNQHGIGTRFDGRRSLSRGAVRRCRP